MPKRRTPSTEFSRIQTERANRARTSLEKYVKLAWDIVEPATRYKPNWHVGAICYHLEAITNGEIQNLVVNVPPGHLKSLLTVVFWPTWEWIRFPHLRYLTASHVMALATRDTVKSRRLILSDWYQRNYGTAFSLTSDQNQKTRYENDKTGYRIAVSIGSGTGERANRVIFDDPHELDDADKPDILAAAVEYKNTTLDSRISDPETDSKVVVQQRVGDADVTADVLEKMEAGGEHYEVLVLPMRQEPSVQLDMGSLNRLDWHDEREEGDLLFPGMYSEPRVKELELRYGDRAAAYLQQNPRSGASLIYKPEYWQPDDTRYVPGTRPQTVIGRYLVVDSAYKDKEANSRTAIVAFEMYADWRIRLVDVWADWVEFPMLLQAIKQRATMHDYDGLLSAVIIEDKASGISALQTLKDAAPPPLSRLLRPFEPGSISKDERDRNAAFHCRVGGVLLPYPGEEVPWLRSFLDEELFKLRPQHRDRRDAFTMGILFLGKYLAAWYQRAVEEMVGLA